MASQGNHGEVVEWLVAQGANVDLLDHVRPPLPVLATRCRILEEKTVPLCVPAQRPMRDSFGLDPTAAGSHCTAVRMRRRLDSLSGSLGEGGIGSGHHRCCGELHSVFRHLLLQDVSPRPVHRKSGLLCTMRRCIHGYNAWSYFVRGAQRSM